MASIYNINNWTSSTHYRKNSIVLQDSKYYYALQEHDSGDFAVDLSNNKWGGRLSYNSEEKNHFIWQPNYSYSLPMEPKVRTIQFGDGITQSSSDGLNNILLNIDLEFNERNLEEYTAILHFLDNNKGYQSFYFVPPQPFNIVKRFVCAKWTPSQQFYDNYNISAQFNERVI